MKTNKKGISLIVLVITIIVMIILAAAIILSLSGSDIRGKAESAVSSTDMSTAKELVAVAQSEWELNYDELTEEYDDFGAYANAKLEKAGISNMVASNTGAVNTLYTDKNGDIAIIPEGFSVSNVSTEKTIDDGLVIIDKDGNEFVWVPVEDFTKFKTTTTYNGTIASPAYVEPYKTSTYTDEETEYLAMRASVQENHGFYIARYEAGKEGKDTVVSKKGATVWNNIAWGDSMTEIGTSGAVYYARQMYKTSKSVVSTLCYGVQWDSALQFISIKDPDYATDSTGKGYYAYSGSGALINPETIQVAGSNDDYAFNNIYDMAGNVWELTMEVRSTVSRMKRGGTVSAPGIAYPAGYRSDDVSSVDYAGSDYGFRLTLYIK